MLIVITLLVVGGIAANVSPWLRGPEEWRWAYAIAGNLARHLISLSAIVVYGVAAFWLAKRMSDGQRPSRRHLQLYLLFFYLAILLV